MKRCSPLLVDSPRAFFRTDVHAKDPTSLTWQNEYSCRSAQSPSEISHMHTHTHLVTIDPADRSLSIGRRNVNRVVGQPSIAGHLFEVVAEVGDRSVGLDRGALSKELEHDVRGDVRPRGLGLAGQPLHFVHSYGRDVGAVVLEEEVQSQCGPIPLVNLCSTK